MLEMHVWSITCLSCLILALGGFYSNILNLALNNVTIEFKLGARFLPIGHRLEIASSTDINVAINFIYQRNYLDRKIVTDWIKF